MDIFKKRVAGHDEYIHYLMQVRKARDEWQSSIKYFESVHEEDLVEYSIYEMEAAKRRYICMLNRLREMYYDLRKNREEYIMQEIPLKGQSMDLNIGYENTAELADVSQDKV